MNQLDYIKSKFLETSQLVHFVNNSNKEEFTDRYFDFQQTLHETNALIEKSQSKEEVLEYMKEGQKRFLVHWGFMHESLEHPSVEHMRSLYYSANLNNPQEWLDKTIVSHEEKKNNRFFELVSKGLKFIDQKIPKQVIDYQEIEDLSKSMIQKYNLNHLHLSDIKPHKVLNFLKTLDKNLQNVCDSLGVTTDIIGIHGKVGFTASPHTEAFFSSQKNTITLGGIMNDSSTALHEWIHALDFEVGSSIVPHQYASNISKSVHVDNSNLYKAFKGIKDLTQEIFSSESSIPLIEPAKQALLKEGTSKFFSELIGYDFYALPENIKNHFHTQQSFDIVNNYLVDRFSPTNQKALTDLLESQGVRSPEISHKINELVPELIYVKPYFDAVNDNIWGKQSFYHLSSKLSIYGLKVNNVISDTVMKGIHFIRPPKVAPIKGNVNDNDYYVQPIEMLARYFESQVFPKRTMVTNLTNIVAGVYSYKSSVDQSFEHNKENIIENVFGKDKILKNIGSIRKNHYSDNNSSLKYGVK